MQKTKNNKSVIKKEMADEVPEWAPLAILVLAALLYFRSLQNGFAGLDDGKYILNNSLIRHIDFDTITSIFSSFFCGNYHPFVLLTFLIEYKFFGLNPLPYHLTNVLLHLVNIALVYKLSEQLSGKKMTALVVSLLFAVHPMHVESVAWVTERKDVLYSLFYLSSLLVYLRYQESGFRLKFYAGALFLFIAALFSKSAAVTLPILMIAIDIYKGRKIDKKSLLEKVPFIILSLFFGIMAVVSQKADGAVYDISLTFGVIDRIFLFTYAIAFYIVKFAIPFNLSAMHYYPETSGGALPLLYYASLPFLLLIAWLVWRNRYIRKEVMFGIFFFLITISVMLQIFPVGRTITSERYSYVSYIGLFYLVGQYISSINKPEVKKIVLGLFTLIIILFTIQAWNRIAVWKNGETLFTDVIKKYPDNYDGYEMRGIEKSNKGLLQEAIEDFNIAIRLKPGFADTYDDRGRAYYQLGKTRLALEDYKKAIRLKPQWEEVYNSRGLAYYQLNIVDSAIQDFNKAIELVPTQAESYMNRGLAYETSGDIKSAMRDFDKAILLNPDFSDTIKTMKAAAYTNLCLRNIKSKDLSEALHDINIAINLVPGNYENYGHRGIIKVMQNNFVEAIRDFDYSLKLKPGEAKVYYNRGVARLSMKDTIGACNDWKIAKDLGHEKAAVQLKIFEKL